MRISDWSSDVCSSDLDLEAVVRAVGQATGKNFVIDPRVKGTVNLVTEAPVSRAQALETLGSVLRMQGYAMVEANGFTKVVPEADAQLQENGRASCRERVCQSVEMSGVAVSLKQ